MTDSLTVAQLAQRAGVSRDTIRYYERRGLLAAAERSPARYRLFHPTTVERVRFIRSKQRLGLPLHDIAELLANVDRSGCAREQARRMLADKVAQIDATMAQLTRMRGEILAVLAESPRDDR